MATWNQKNASRTNGACSKGPVTPEGKAKVSQNGLRHGLYAKQTVLRNEDPAQYAEFREIYLRDYTPVTEMETDLVLDIADARWRLRRFRVLETAALDFEMERMRAEVDATFDTMDEASRTMLAFNSLISMNRTFEVLQTSIRAQHRIVDRATSQLLRLRRIRPDSGGDAGPNPTGKGPSLVKHAQPPAPVPATEPELQPATTTTNNHGTEPSAQNHQRRVLTFPAARSTSATTQNQGTKPGEPHTLGLCA